MADADEHIFSRKLFTIANRANLPKAPGCKLCNGAKLDLEHYLTAVLPFGGRHADATETLKMVSPRLAKNAKLHRKLAAQSSSIWARTDGGLIVRSMSLPFEAAKLEAYFAYVVRGLLWHHWLHYLPEGSFVEPMCLSPAGEIERLLGLKAQARVAKSLGV